MTLVERVRKRAKELDDEIIKRMGRDDYIVQQDLDRKLLEDCAEALAASRVDHPISDTNGL